MKDLFHIIVFLLPLISFLYASVGHGGASSYIILLTLLNYSSTQVKTTALLLNIAVSLIAFLMYFQSLKNQYKLLLPLLLASIPAAFIGGTIQLDENYYRKILGVLLIFPVLRFTGVISVLSYPNVKPNTQLLLCIGLIIGFASGIIGIGGGIILAPILLLLGWADMKETASISAAFIFFNSIAAFIGNGVSLQNMNPDLIKVIPLTITGGIMGAYLGAKKFRSQTLTYVLTLVLFLASVKLIIG